MQDAGVPPEQSETMPYAAMRALEALETNVGGKIDGLGAKLDTLETNIDGRNRSLNVHIVAWGILMVATQIAVRADWSGVIGFFR